MKKILFVYPTNRQELLDEVKGRTSPDNALYGLNHMQEFGYRAFARDVSPTLERLLDIIFSPLHKLFFSQIDIDFKLPRALLMLPAFSVADLIVTNTDGIGLAVCFLKRLGLVKKPIIYAVGLFYIKGKMESSIRKNKETFFIKFYKWIISSADQILYHSEIEKEKLTKLALYNPAICTFIPMGSDPSFFKLAKFAKIKKLKNTLVSVGKDRSRDYRTLFEAVSQISNISTIVVCRKSNLLGLKIPKNVKVYFDLPYLEVTKFYNRATIIVIPNREMHRSSGQMTLTDCLQCAKPIVVSDIVGLAHYPLKNNFNVIKVPPQDSELLKVAIVRLLADNRLQTKLIKNTRALALLYSTKNYAHEIIKIINWVKGDVRLKPIAGDDLEFMRRLRNQNRGFFIDSHFIKRKDQVNWVRSYSQKHNDYMFILKKGAKKIGTGAIYNIDENKKNAQIGRFIVDQEFRGQGYGKILLQKIEELAFNKLNMESLNLEVLAHNSAAVKLYRESGFVKQKEMIIKGKRVISMIKKKNTI